MAAPISALSSRHVARGQHLREHEGIGQRQRAQRQAGRQVALDDPDPGQRAEQEQRDHADLRKPAQHEEAIPSPRAAGRDGGAHRLAPDAASGYGAAPLRSGARSPGTGVSGRRCTGVWKCGLSPPRSPASQPLR